MSLASRIVSTLCSRGLLSPRDDFAALVLIESEITRDREQSSSLSSLRCGVCEQHFGRPLVEKHDVPCCETCLGLLEQAIACRVSVVRFRCRPWQADAPPTCGRVWGTPSLATWLGHLVEDADRVCPTCRPRQSAHVDAFTRSYEEASA